VVRFGIVGLTATLLQFGVYELLLPLMNATLANTIAYIVSFVFNYFASTRFTFRVSGSARRGMGFAFSHVVNYLLQTLFLNLFIRLGIPPQWAPLPMFCLCVPINFLLVRYFLKK